MDVDTGAECQVELEDTSFTGKCLVTDKCSLLGLDWLRRDPHGRILNLKFISNAISQVTESPSDNADEMALMKKIKAQYPEVIEGKMGTCLKYEAEILLKMDAKLLFKKARPVAYAILPDVTKEIERLEDSGVIERSDSSLLAAPSRGCSQKQRRHPTLREFFYRAQRRHRRRQLPSSRSEDIFNNLNGGKFFSKIDLIEAYLRVPVAAGCQNILAINTPKGLFSTKRLPFE
ncbi:uncharacterized protein K02A2.6-like [Galendromus occidentalis]|uniref:Uncharacterized protein K02A2.6-like n=1 Tax=Galendromus occidentalis TaxID=34638 RepID=A0AAJ7L4D4_9ACAR|nr:uncharacterized protein K02A2.6-like [Galendromus occidentalis]